MSIEISADTRNEARKVRDYAESYNNRLSDTMVEQRIEAQPEIEDVRRCQMINGFIHVCYSVDEVIVYKKPAWMRHLSLRVPGGKGEEFYPNPLQTDAVMQLYGFKSKASEVLGCLIEFKGERLHVIEFFDEGMPNIRSVYAGAR